MELAGSGRAIELPPGAAAGLRDLAKVPAQKGVGKLLGKPEAWTVVFDPTKDTRE